MATINHLFRREATYYWRARLPLSLASILGRSHLARSLRTTEPNRARRLARRLSAVVEEVCHLLKAEAMKGRKSPTRADLDRILLDLFAEVLETGEVIRAARPTGYSPFTIRDDDEAEAAVDGCDPHTGAPLDSRDLQEDQMETDIGWNWRTHLKHNVLTPIIPAVDAMLSERNLDRLADDADWRLFLRKAMATVGAALDIESEREQGIYRAPIHPFVSNEGAPTVGVGGSGAEFARQRVSEVFEANIATKLKEGSWKPNSGSEKQARIALRLFIAFKGDLPFAQVQKADAWAFREWLCGLPSLVGKSIYADLDYPEAIQLREAIAAALEKTPARRSKTDDAQQVLTVQSRRMTRAEAEVRADKMSKKTVNKHLTFFSDAFGQKILRSGYPLTNPFKGTLFSKVEVAEEANRREVWAEADLQCLFTSPLWTGSVGTHNRVKAREGGYLADDGKFWIPLIALFTGMRENEIASLDTGHIIRDPETSAWIFLVAQARRSGKTKAAQRKIPVHPLLERIGLIEYRDAVKASGSQHLFPELRNRNSKPGQIIGKWFSEYCRTCGIYQRWRDFHALRHTFKTRLVRQLQAHPIMVNEVMGHRQADEMDIIYFHGFTPADTVPTIRALSYDSLNLTHLFRSKQPGRQFFPKAEWVDEDVSDAHSLSGQGVTGRRGGGKRTAAPVSTNGEKGSLPAKRGRKKTKLSLIPGKDRPGRGTPPHGAGSDVSELKKRS